MSYRLLIGKQNYDVNIYRREREYQRRKRHGAKLNTLQGHDDDFVVSPASFKSFVHGRKWALERKNKNREEEQRRRTKKKEERTKR